jgi:hypothetical protein
MSWDPLDYPATAAAIYLVAASSYFLVTINQRDPACAFIAGWWAGVASTICLATFWTVIHPSYPGLESPQTVTLPHPALRQL